MAPSAINGSASAQSPKTTTRNGYNDPVSNSAPIISYETLASLQRYYKGMYLFHKTDQRLPLEHELNLQNEWDDIVHDVFEKIYQVNLKCSCSATHYNRGIEEAIENLREIMERVTVLDISEEDVRGWDEELKGLVRLYWEEFERDGGCPELRPKPGTLVNGTLVLDEGEERVKGEWMKDLFAPGGLMGEEGDVCEEEEEVESDGESQDEVGSSGVPFTEDVGLLSSSELLPSIERDDDGEDEEEVEREGLASRLLKELGMENYEYRGKEVGKDVDG